LRGKFLSKPIEFTLFINIALTPKVTIYLHEGSVPSTFPVTFMVAPLQDCRQTYSIQAEGKKGEVNVITDDTRDESQRLRGGLWGGSQKQGCLFERKKYASEDPGYVEHEIIETNPAYR
jgi:hypothetical protein